MKLTEFNAQPKMLAKKALKENFNTDLNLSKFGLKETADMLRKVKGLLATVKESNDVHTSEQNPAYLKLIFMEQALVHHYGDLKAQPLYNARIVVENEEVEQAQVVLAAKDMMDSVQKMVEDVSDMLVKELPAIVDSVNSEIGTNEGEQYNMQATEALSGLQAALTTARAGLQSALGIVTGQGGGMLGGIGDDAMSGEASLGGDMPMPGEEAELGAMDAEELGEPEAEEEPEEIPLPRLGRAKR